MDDSKLLHLKRLQCRSIREATIYLKAALSEFTMMALGRNAALNVLVLATCIPYLLCVHRCALCLSQEPICGSTAHLAAVLLGAKVSVKVGAIQIVIIVTVLPQPLRAVAQSLQFTYAAGRRIQ